MLVRKVLRDLRQNAVQFLAIYIMTLLALLIVSGFDSSDTGVFYSAAEYLTDVNYKDLDVSGGSFTASDIAVLEQLPGIAHVDGIRNGTGKTVAGGQERPLLISYTGGDQVSRMFLTEGEAYAPGKKGVWVEDWFARPMGIRPGDMLTFTMDNRTYHEEVRGLVFSPNYLYYVPNSTYTEPEYGTHGFLIMDISEAPADGLVFDQLIVDLEEVRGQGILLTDEEKEIMRSMREEVVHRLDNPKLLVRMKTEDDNYKDYVGSQESNAIAIVFPTIFMAVAVLGIITTMARLTGKQRLQIGTMKALGFSRTTITLHYMSYSVIIALLGCASGIVLGTYTLGAYLNEMNDYYYQNPYIRLQLTSKSLYMTLLAVGLCVLVTYVSTRKLLVQNASDILRPEPPRETGAGFLERYPIWQRLQFSVRWNIRDVWQNKLRTLVSVFGILVCSMLLYTATGYYVCLRAQAPWMYGDIVTADWRMTFEDGTGYGTVYDYAREYAGQMIQEIPATIYSDTAESVRNMIVLEEGNLFNIQDEELEETTLPAEGIALTSRLTETLGVGVGDTLRWRIAGNDRVYSAVINLICRQASDQGIVMSRRAWEKLGGEFRPNMIYSRRTIPTSLKTRPEVSTVDSAQTLKTALINANSIGYTITTILVTMAVVMGVIVLYNLGVLSYIEKVREIATLKVLGFQSWNIRVMLMQQNLAVTAIGAILGVPVGMVILEILVDLVMGDFSDMAIRLDPMPFVVAVIGTFGVSMLVNLYVTSKVKEIDMVEALKGVE